MFVVMHYLEPVAVFKSATQANLFADAIKGDVFLVPVVTIEGPIMCEGPTDGD